jgi:hypothetical protein
MNGDKSLLRRRAFRISMLLSFGLSALFGLCEAGVINERFGRVEAGILLLCFFLAAYAMTRWQRENEKKIDEQMDRLERKIRQMFD